MNTTTQTMLNEINRYAYQPGINPFGVKLTATSLEGKYAELQQALAAKAQANNEFRVRMMAQYR